MTPKELMNSQYVRAGNYELILDLYHKVTRDRLTLTITDILTRNLGPYHTVRDVRAY